MKFRFLGTEACPKEITLRGQTFAKGKTVDVDDALSAERLANLEYFEVVKERKKKSDDKDGE